MSLTVGRKKVGHTWDTSFTESSPLTIYNHWRVLVFHWGITTYDQSLQQSWKNPHSGVPQRPYLLRWSSFSDILGTVPGIVSRVLNLIKFRRLFIPAYGAFSRRGCVSNPAILHSLPKYGQAFLTAIILWQAPRNSKRST